MTEQNALQKFDRRRAALVASHGPRHRLAAGPLPLYVRADEVQQAGAGLGQRPRLMVRCYWELGPRASELLAVRVGDVDFNARAIRLMTLKRRKPHARVVPLSPGLLGDIAVAINSCGLAAGDRLFPWSRSRAFEIVRDALLAAGVDRPRANIRALRHGHAVHALLNGVPLNVLQEVLGHASAVTTAIYTRVIGRDIADYYSEIEW